MLLFAFTITENSEMVLKISQNVQTSKAGKLIFLQKLYFFVISTQENKNTVTAPPGELFL